MSSMFQVMLCELVNKSQILDSKSHGCQGRSYLSRQWLASKPDVQLPPAMLTLGVIVLIVALRLWVLWSASIP